MKNYILMTMLMVSSVAINGMDVNDNYLSSITLLKAAKAGNLVALRACLADNANVNYANDKGTTALIKAASKGHLEICKVLIAHRANICLKDHKGSTPLMRAAKSNKLEICELLMDNMLFEGLQENMCTALGCLKYNRTPLANNPGLNYHMMQDLLGAHCRPMLLELQRKNGPRALDELNKIKNGPLKIFLVKKYCDQLKLYFN
jgi:ankyrin repeat protein